MMVTSSQFTFIGEGSRSALLPHLDTIQPLGGRIGKWIRHQGDAGVEDDLEHPNHPANYRARAGLADAVNTAIALGKPLLLTGLPGTGKSQLAERIAWEFNIGPVLRFEAQSLSEANDLFYRFDLVGHLSTVELAKLDKELGTGTPLDRTRLTPEHFIKLGPLGEAIVRSNPASFEKLFTAVFGREEYEAAVVSPRPSVVLIDEIDKASRDFPNDLLNGIDRAEFRIRELGLELMRVHPERRPIVIVTSNSERDLPGPFLRRCTFFHIEEPKQEELREIVRQRFFVSDGSGADELPAAFNGLVDAFWNFREANKSTLQYWPGTSELIDWVSALRSQAVEQTSPLVQQLDAVKRAASAVSKHQNDQKRLRDFLDGMIASSRPAAV